MIPLYETESKNWIINKIFKKIIYKYNIMTTELLRQITEISNEIKNIYGNDYGEQYSNVAIKLLNQYPNNMNEYHILIEATHSLIDCDHKDKLIISLEKKIKEQEIRILKLEKDKETFYALVKLHKCNAILTKVFKNEYKEFFYKKGASIYQI